MKKRKKERKNQVIESNLNINIQTFMHMLPYTSINIHSLTHIYRHTEKKNLVIQTEKEIEAN